MGRVNWDVVVAAASKLAFVLGVALFGWGLVALYHTPDAMPPFALVVFGVALALPLIRSTVE